MKRKLHSTSWDRCVQAVKRRGKAMNPYAVCTAALKEMSFRQKKNPSKVSDPAHRKLVKELASHFAMDERALKSRKGPWPKGRTPKHLRKYLFKKR